MKILRQRLILIVISSIVHYVLLHVKSYTNVLVIIIIYNYVRTINMCINNELLGLSLYDKYMLRFVNIRCTPILNNG